MNLNSKEVRFSALMSPVKRVLSGLSQVNFNLVGFFFLAQHVMCCQSTAGMITKQDGKRLPRSKN